MQEQPANLGLTLDSQVKAALQYIGVSPEQFGVNTDIVHFNVAEKAPYDDNIIHVPRVQLIFARGGATRRGLGVKYDYQPSKFGIASVDEMVPQVLQHYSNKGLTLDNTLDPNR